MSILIFLRTALKCLGTGALLWTLATPWAVAGPEQDSELALKEFNRGDLVAAMRLWRSAAQQGYAPAQVWLGDILDKAEEDAEAVDWYRKAAAQGSASGEFGLGQMYAKGEGVKKDLEQARIHVLRAADQGHVAAVAMLMESYRSGGLGLAADPAQADAWEAKLIKLSPDYRRAPAKVDAKAQKGDSK